MAAERIDKLLAGQGMGSRTEVHRLLKAGRVEADGKIVLRPEYKVDADIAKIVVDGKLINFNRFVYIMQNKPIGVISASRGSDSRPTVIDILPPELKRKNLFPAGRLDADTVGFVLITDDGDFAHRILSPKNHVPKTYYLTTDIPAPPDTESRILEGITLGNGNICRPANLTVLGPTEFRLVLREGMYHQIKRMFGALDCKVTYLKREKIGRLSLDPALKPGESRLLSLEEAGLLSFKD